MKIVHVITRLILGGAQENTLLTCEGLHARGHDVTLITGPALGPEGELMTRAQRGGYRVIVLDDMRREIHLRHDHAVQKQLVKLFRELRPDVVHTHSSKAGILGRKAAGKVKGEEHRQVEDSPRRNAHVTPIIVHTIHGLPFHPYQSWWRNRLYIALEKQAAKRTDAIICVADAMTRQALAAGVGRPEQFVTIYSGMETRAYAEPTPRAAEFRASLNLPPGAVLVTQVSRLAELKGHDYIIEAAAGLGEHVHFCFAGDGYLRGRIERHIARLGLGSRFHLTGLLPPDDIPAVMQASDVVVHCSLREGLARTLPQAMLAGKPVISFDVDGAAEVVEPDTGILLNPKNVPDLRAAIELLAASPGAREELGSAGREKCLTMFDHDRMVRQIEQVYERLMK